MTNSTKIQDLKLNDLVCFNCEYRIWGVALGVGVLCSNEKNKVDNKLYKIPNRNHTCELFKLRETGNR